MDRKLISTALAGALLCGVINLQAYSEAQPTVKVDSVSAEPGTIAEVPIKITGNAGFSNLAIEIGYDSRALTLTEVKENPLAGAAFTTAQRIESNPYNMQWDSAGNITFNGELAILCFRIDDEAAGVFPITVDYYKGRNGDNIPGDDINYDEDFEPVEFAFLGGGITVINETAEPVQTTVPTEKPMPTPEPTATPTPESTATPTPEPTATPTPEPTATPTPESTATPTPKPTATPTPEPTATPTPEPTATLTPESTATPTPEPTATPTPEPTATPTPEPTATPTPESTATPTPESTAIPVTEISATKGVDGDGIVIVNVELSAAAAGRLYAAVYDEEGRLEAVKSQDTDDEKQDYHFILPDAVGMDIRIMLWDVIKQQDLAEAVTAQ